MWTSKCFIGEVKPGKVEVTQWLRITLIYICDTLKTRIMLEFMVTCHVQKHMFIVDQEDGHPVFLG